jgi:hypothetical protein
MGRGSKEYDLLKNFSKSIYYFMEKTLLTTYDLSLLLQSYL